MKTRLANRSFKTMKYRVNYHGRFEDLSEESLWLSAFVHFDGAFAFHDRECNLGTESVRRKLFLNRETQRCDRLK